MSSSNVAGWVCNGYETTTNPVDENLCSLCGGPYDFRRSPEEIATRYRAAEEEIQAQLFVDAMDSCGVHDLPVKRCQHHLKNIHARRARLDCANCNACIPALIVNGTLQQIMIAMKEGAKCWRCGISWKEHKKQENGPMSQPDPVTEGVESSLQSRIDLDVERGGQAVGGAPPSSSPKPRKKPRRNPEAVATMRLNQQNAMDIDEPPSPSKETPGLLLALPGERYATRYMRSFNPEQQRLNALNTYRPLPPVMPSGPASTSVVRPSCGRLPLMEPPQGTSTRPVPPLGGRLTSFCGPNYPLLVRIPIVPVAPPGGTKRRAIEPPRTESATPLQSTAPAQSTKRAVSESPRIKRTAPAQPTNRVILSYRTRRIATTMTAPPAALSDVQRAVEPNMATNRQEHASVAGTERSDAEVEAASTVNNTPQFTVHIRLHRQRAARAPKVTIVEEEEDDEDEDS